MNGILLLDKKTGFTSTWCVNHIKKSLPKKLKVGHAGTLDSTASGMLVIVLGKATRLSSYIMDLPKVYRVRVRLGAFTDTDDYSGTIREVPFSFRISEDMIDRCILSFQGIRMQIPPQISAVRIKGERAHQLSRRGEVPKLRPRPVNVEYIRRITSLYNNTDFNMEIKCHKGTYIRSIVRDLGKTLGCGAYVQDLQRISTGLWSLYDHKIMSCSSCFSEEIVRDKLLPISEIRHNFNSYALSKEQETQTCNGLPLELKDLEVLNRSSCGPLKHILLLGQDLLCFARIREETYSSTYRVEPETNILLRGMDK